MNKFKKGMKEFGKLVVTKPNNGINRCLSPKSPDFKAELVKFE
jgi:hypothetical protein